MDGALLKNGFAVAVTIALAIVATDVMLPDRGHAQMAAPSRSAETRYGFSIELSFTPNALSNLKKRGEKVIASAYYYGDPTRAGSIHANEAGQVDLGNEEARVTAKPGQVILTGNKVEAEKLRWIDGDVSVNVNVYTARLSSPDNLISCDFIDGPVEKVRALQPIPLRCALISEAVEAKLKP